MGRVPADIKVQRGEWKIPLGALTKKKQEQWGLGERAGVENCLDGWLLITTHTEKYKEK